MAKVAHEIRHADRFGLVAVNPTVDLGRVNAHVRATIERVYEFERPDVLKAVGIDFHSDGACFVGFDAVVAGDPPGPLRARAGQDRSGGPARHRGNPPCRGIDLRLRHTAERVETTRGGVAVVGAGERVEGDALLVALGREPNVAQLDLERAGIRVTARGIVVDSSLRTTNPRVYACGDVIGGPQFRHYAAWLAHVAVRNALLPGTTIGIKPHVPWAVFTDPEVATVGLTEAEARQKYGDDVVVCTVGLDHVDRAQTEAETRGLVKVIARRHGEILGAHLVAGRAGEMIQEYVEAMAHRLRLDQLAGGDPRLPDLRDRQSTTRGRDLDDAPPAA